MALVRTHAALDGRGWFRTGNGSRRRAGEIRSRCSRKGETFDQAIATFSERYANQNELDYAALADAAKSAPSR